MALSDERANAAPNVFQRDHQSMNTQKQPSAEDIVDKLERLAGVLPHAMWSAADEIKNLRMEIKQLQAIIRGKTFVTDNEPCAVKYKVDDLNEVRCVDDSF